MGWNSNCHAILVAAALSQDLNSTPLEKNISFCLQPLEQIEIVKYLNSFPHLNSPFSLTASEKIEKYNFFPFCFFFHTPGFCCASISCHFLCLNDTWTWHGFWFLLLHCSATSCVSRAPETLTVSKEGEKKNKTQNNTNLMWGKTNC